MQRLVDLIQPIQRIDGNTEVTAVAAMENNELIQKLVRVIETSSSLLKKQEEAVEALEEIASESGSNKGDDQVQHEDLEEKEHKEEMARAETSRFQRLEKAFEKLTDKMKALGGGGLDILAKMGKVLAALVAQYFFPFIVDLAKRVLPTLANGLAWVFSNFMSLGQGIGDFLGRLIPGIESGAAGAVGAFAGLAAAIWLVLNPLRAIKMTLNLLSRAFEFASKRIAASPTAGAATGAGDLVGGGGENEQRRGRRSRRGGRAIRKRPQQTSAPRPAVRPPPVAKTVATGVPGRVVQSGAGAAAGQTAIRAIPVVGTAAAAGLGAYGAYTSLQDIDAAVAAGEMTSAQASEAKGEAIGGAAGGVAGALGGAAAGAAIGSAVPVVGTAIGGIVGGIAGYYGGDWLGSKAGGAIGASSADKPAAALPAITPAEVPPAPTFWNPEPEDDKETNEERFLRRMFKEQVDYFILQSKTTPLITQDVGDFRKSAVGSGVPDRAIAWPSPAPGGTTSIPTTRSSGVSPSAYTGDGTLGFIAKKYETGGAGAGTVSTGAGDAGGVSYGSFQMASNRGTVQRYLAQSKYGAEFAGMQVNTAEFQSKWKEIAARDSEGFQADQFAFIKAGHYDPAVRAIAQRVGVDVNSRGRAVQEAVFSTAVQFGPGTAASLMAGAGVTDDMTDVQIIQALQQRKRDRNDTLFRSSSANVRAGTFSRASREEADLLALAARSDSRSPISPATRRGAGSTLASVSGELAIGSHGGPVAASNINVAPVNAPTTVIQGGGGRGGSPQRSATPHPAVAYDVGAIA